MVAISGGSDADDGRRTRVPSIAVTAAPKRVRLILSPSRRPPTLHNLSLSNLVNSHFLDERWFDLHSLDNDFHFLDSRCGWPDKKVVLRSAR